MKMKLVAALFIAITLSGCQSNQVKPTEAKLTEADASKKYYECIYSQYNSAVSNGVASGEKSIDAAIDNCGDDAMNYAMVFAREYHENFSKHREHAHWTYKPIIEKNAKSELTKYISQ